MANKHGDDSLTASLTLEVSGSVAALLTGAEGLFSRHWPAVWQIAKAVVEGLILMGVLAVAV